MLVIGTKSITSEVNVEKLTSKKLLSEGVRFAEAADLGERFIGGET